MLCKSLEERLSAAVAKVEALQLTGASRWKRVDQTGDIGREGRKEEIDGAFMLCTAYAVPIRPSLTFLCSN